MFDIVFYYLLLYFNLHTIQDSKNNLTKYAVRAFIRQVYVIGNN